MNKLPKGKKITKKDFLETIRIIEENQKLINKPKIEKIDKYAIFEQTKGQSGERMLGVCVDHLINKVNEIIDWVK